MTKNQPWHRESFSSVVQDNDFAREPAILVQVTDCDDDSSVVTCQLNTNPSITDQWNQSTNVGKDQPVLLQVFLVKQNRHPQTYIHISNTRIVFGSFLHDGAKKRIRKLHRIKQGLKYQSTTPVMVHIKNGTQTPIHTPLHFAGQTSFYHPTKYAKKTNIINSNTCGYLPSNDAIRHYKCAL